MKQRSQLLGLVAAVLLAAVWIAFRLLDISGGGVPAPTTASVDAEQTRTATAGADLGRLFQERRSGEVVESSGTVERRLSDDLEGSRHQRFIIRLDSGQTLLISHNIDLAQRVPVDEGDFVEFRGQYEWNERGGVMHWTHADPQGRRPGGWIRHRDRVYR